MSRIRWYGPSLLLLVTLVLAMVLGPWMVKKIARSYEAARIAQVRQELVDDPTLTMLSDSFEQVATSIRPSVTSILVQARGGPESDFPGRLENVSNGSGWVYRYYPDFERNDQDYEDFIITNHHVVEIFLRGRAEQLIVRFEDGGEYRAEVVGTDERSDIAVLSIDRDDLIPAPLSPEPAVQGEIVFAIGSPFQFDFSMSQGIVSATGRRVNHSAINNYENYIQTDAAINPGNSGGPLTNVRGQVLGMNTAIAVNGRPETTFSGLGFAIPVQQIVNVANQLIETGDVRRGYIGVYTTELDAATKREMGFEGRGVLCAPDPGGPAARAGLRMGDIITHVQREAVTNPDALRIAVSSHPPNSQLAIRVWRRGSYETFDVTLGGHPGYGGSRELDSPFEPAPRNLARELGLGRFQTLTPNQALQWGWAYTPGVVITLVETGSPAARERIARLTVVTEVNGTPVHDVNSFLDAVQQAEDGRLTLGLKRWDIHGDTGYDARVVTLEPR